LATYSRLRYKEVYPGIDLLFYGNQGTLEYDFVVAPGADPGRIRLRVNGMASVNGHGELQLGSGPEATLHRPVLYQNITGGKKTIAGRFARQADGSLVFNCGDYDRTKTLVIDPTVNLLYATYIGGIHDDEAYTLALDPQNNSYILGKSASADYPISANAYQNQRTDIGTYTYNMVLTKISPAGVLLYSTFIGDGTDLPFRTPVLAADAQGNAWIGGVTLSATYPVTANAYQPVFPLPANTGYTYPSPFISEISSDGSTLAYSTFFAGPTGQDYNVFGIAVKGSGHVYLAGIADSGLPTTPGAYLATIPSGNIANFVAVFNPALTGSAQLLASSYFGFSNFASTTLTGMALDASANPWITFNTNDPGLPTTANAIQPNAQFSNSLFCGEGIQRGLSDGGYVAKLSSDLTTVLYGSYLSGGQGDVIGSNPATNDAGCDESIVAAASDANGDLYMVGYSGSDKFPTTPGAYQTYQQDFTSGVGPGLRFVAALRADGSQLLFSTFLGGTQYPNKVDFLAVDGQQNAWIASNAAVPITAGALQPSLIANQGNGAVAEISSDGTTLLYGTYLPQVQSPGPCYAIYRFNNDTTPCNLAIAGFAVDPESNAYIAGTVAGAMAPVTANAFQGQFANGDANNDGSDIFFMILGGGTFGTLSTTTGGNSGDVTVTIDGSGLEQGATCSLVQGGATISATNVLVNSNGTSATCTFALNNATTGAYDVAVSNPDGTGFTASGAFTVKAGVGPNIWGTVTGRPAIRTNTPANFDFTVGNSGDTDGYGIPVTFQIPSGFSLAIPGVPTTVLNPNDLVYTDGSDGTQFIQLVVPHLAPRASVEFVLQLTDPSSTDAWSVGMTWESAAFSSIASAQAGLNTLTITDSCSGPGGCLGLLGSTFAGTLNGALADMAQTEGFTYDSNQALTSFLQYYASAVAEGINDDLFGTDSVVSGVTRSQAATPRPRGVGVVVGCCNGISITPTNNAPVAISFKNTGFPYITSAIKIPLLNKPLIGPLEKNQVNQLQDQITGKLLGNPQTVCAASGGTYNGQNMKCCDPCGDLIPGIQRCQNFYGCNFTSPPSTETEPGIPYLISCDPNNPDKCHGGGGNPDNGCKALGFGSSSFSRPPLQAHAAGSGPGDGGAQSCQPGKTGGSTDPNYKSGSSGDQSASQYVAATRPLAYNLGFENEPTATLPASQVVVTDQLDPTKVDLTTLALGNIAFGSTLISPPPATNSYNTLYPINSSLSVRIQGSLNPATGLLKWTFTSIDPSTGLPPSDPTVGFLPPDADGVEGQGSVTFTAMPKGGQTTGTQITNQATVVFDANAPISTPVWLNTLDVNLPVSSVQALPQAEAQNTFTVGWSGTDVGSGIASYTIYVSENGGPFTIFQNAVVTTSASFTGQAGTTYAFYSIATDGAGNVQAAKTVADTSTTIVGGTGPGGACDVGNYGSVNVSDVQAEINQAIGITAPVNDLNGDKMVNVVDIQIVMNAALHLGCTQ
jgi:hypothetical protein